MKFEMANVFQHIFEIFFQAKNYKHLRRYLQEKIFLFNIIGRNATWILKLRSNYEEQILHHVRPDYIGCAVYVGQVTLTCPLGISYF